MLKFKPHSFTFNTVTQVAAAEVFGANEIAPLQRRFEQPNEWIGDETYDLRQPPLPAAGHNRARCRSESTGARVVGSDV